MLELLSDRYMVDLCCDEQLVPFYERLGLSRLTATVTSVGPRASPPRSAAAHVSAGRAAA